MRALQHHLRHFALSFYQTEDGDRGRVVMSPEGNDRDGYRFYQFTDRPFRGILSNIRFDIVGNDNRIRDLTIEAVDTPSFLSPVIASIPPDYTNLTAREDAAQAGLRLPLGSHIELRAMTNRPMESIEVIDVTQATETRIPMPPGAPQTQVRIPLGSLDTTHVYEFYLHDVHGLVNDDPFRVTVEAIPDEPPDVELALTGIGTAITPNAILPLRGHVVDGLPARFRDTSARANQQRWNGPGRNRRCFCRLCRPTHGVTTRIYSSGQHRMVRCCFAPACNYVLP